MFWTVVLFIIFTYIIVKWFILARGPPNPLDDLPGPYRYPIVGNIFEFVGSDSATLFAKLRKFKLEHGDRYIIRILDRRILHLHHPDDFETVLSHSRNIKKNKPYDFLKAWLGSGLLLSTGNKWHRRRKVLTPAFHFNILKNFSEIIQEKSRKLVKEIQELGEEAVVDVTPVITNFTLHTICETAMGTQLDVDKSNEAIRYKRAILNIGSTLMNRLMNVWMHPDIIFGLSGQGKLFNKSVSTACAFADNVITERKKTIKEHGGDMTAAVLDGEEYGGKKRLAMLDLLLAAEAKDEIDLDGIREEVNTFMFEGHDTTAMALTFALMLLGKHKAVQDKMYEECMNIFGDACRAPSMSDLAEMKYTEAVIKEALRLYPSVPIIAREIVEDFMLGDLLVKADTEVALHIYDLQRHEYFYKDPDAFIPERWLEGNATSHTYAYVPFSAGLRNCIGQRFASLEMKCVLSDITRTFVLETLSDYPRLHAELVLRPIEPVMVKFIRR